MWGTLFSLSSKLVSKMTGISTKIYIIVIILLAFAFAMMSGYAKLQSVKVESLEAKLESLNGIIDRQNEKIKENAIKQNDKSVEVKEKVITKYKTIPEIVYLNQDGTTVDADCQSKLKALDEMQKLYFYE